ncbi:MAG: tripartite tricarboxylate transporter TctB family protein [Burkholderiaceae bacterium]|nr:tripartite tricarboxylate transporter TctB family protein [Burkholderiaceae bacterium]MCD8564515.1 tripartite tricarboxylate transporter TctB family protein [Burkholderiaceae bacterium]
MKQKDVADIIGGILITAVGIFAVIHSQQYDMGQLRQMGPGFFPTAIGIILVVLGVFITLPALLRRGPAVKVNFKGLFWVMLSIFVFAVTLDYVGLPIAVMLSVIAATGASTLTWRSRSYLAIGVAIITYLIFSIGLGMNMPVMPTIGQS